MSSTNNKNNLSLTIAISVALTTPTIMLDNMHWIATAEADESTSQSGNLEDREIEAFANSYTYEDAVLLAKFWGKPTPWDAKLKIGSLLLNGDNDAVQQALNNARQASLEDEEIKAFANSYSYEDAALLAKFWGKPTPWDAKLKIGSLLLNGNNTAVQQALSNAQAQ
ncbi:MAG: hypothetical protein ACU83U_07465 [Gammaproteobacteria bacterium]